MWVEKTKTGFRACERIKLYGKTKMVTVHFDKDTPRARKSAFQALSDKIDTLMHPATNKPLNELVELYLDKKDCKESTRNVSRINMNNIMSIIGDIPPDPALINQKLLESAKSPKTINTYLQTFRAFLRWCYKYGYIEQDIAPRIVPLPDRSPKTPSEEKYLEPEELRSVLSQLSGMTYYLCKFLALTGCRIGEALVLTMDDLDGDVIHITKTLAGHTVTSPKTESSVRDIYIQPELAELLSEYKEYRLKYLMSYGIRTDRLFFSPHGNTVCQKRAARQLRQAECNKHLHFHIFRHTHVALLAEQGVPLEVISRRLGHENSKITKDIYYHVTNLQKEKDKKMIQKIRIIS